MPADGQQVAYDPNAPVYEGGGTPTQYFEFEGEWITQEAYYERLRRIYQELTGVFPDYNEVYRFAVGTPTAEVRATFEREVRAWQQQQAAERQQRAQGQAPLNLDPSGAADPNRLGLFNQDEVGPRRLPMPWMGPNYFMDEDTGFVYRVSSEGKLRRTGHYNDLSPGDQQAIQYLYSQGYMGGEKGGGGMIFEGGMPLDLPANATPQQIMAAIQAGASGVKGRRESKGFLYEYGPQIASTILGIIGNAFLPYFGGVLGSTVGNIHSQAVIRGRVDMEQVAKQAAVAGITAAATYGIDSSGLVGQGAEKFGIVGNSVMEATGSRAAALAAEAAVRSTMSGLTGALVSGGDIEQALMNAAINGISSAVSSGAASGLNEVLSPGSLASLVTKGIANLGIGAGKGYLQDVLREESPAPGALTEQDYRQRATDVRAQGAQRDRSYQEQLSRYRDRYDQQRRDWEARYAEAQRKYAESYAAYYTRLQEQTAAGVDRWSKAFKKNQDPTPEYLQQLAGFFGQPAPSSQSLSDPFQPSRAYTGALQPTYGVQTGSPALTEPAAQPSSQWAGYSPALLQILQSQSSQDRLGRSLT